MERGGFFLVITRCEVRYRRPVRYDDLVEVRTTLGSASRVKLRHAYEIAVVERAGAAPDPADPSVPPGGCSICDTGRTSPPSPTSPITTVLAASDRR